MFVWKLSLNDATDMLTAGCWPRRCGWSGDTRTHHARTGAGLRGGTTGIPPLAEAAPLGEERRSVRPQAPLEDKFAEGNRAWWRTGVMRDHDALAIPIFDRKQDQESCRDQGGRSKIRLFLRQNDAHRLAALHPLLARWPGI